MLCRRVTPIHLLHPCPSSPSGSFHGWSCLWALRFCSHCYKKKKELFPVRSLHLAVLQPHGLSKCTRTPSCAVGCQLCTHVPAQPPKVIWLLTEAICDRCTSILWKTECNILKTISVTAFQTKSFYENIKWPDWCQPQSVFQVTNRFL